MMKKTILLALALLCIQFFSAQSTFWQPSNAPSSLKQNIPTERQLIVGMDMEQLSAFLATAPDEKSISAKESPAIITFPSPEGESMRFSFVYSPIMEDALAERYPDIRTYSGQGIDDPTATVRFDVTPSGLHAMIIGKTGTIYIDPFSKGNTEYYQVYWKEDFYALTQKTFEELPPAFGSDFQIEEEKLPPSGGKKKPYVHDNPIAKAATPSGSQLRTYRLALATTGEYTAFHGGTVAGALAAMVTSMNRVNEVYERDVAIRMVLVGNTDQIIFTDASTDPYSNGNGGAMLGQNQTTCDNVIGSANYDIGHVYSTGGGGVAFLQSVCGGSKAGGVTGQAVPVGDPFDIDYVCHEMGHQFGGNHTQNNTCNRSTNAAYEPGSASTIMGYAGICAVNLQSNSDDYFHNHSYNEIISFSQSGNGNTCATTSNTGNTPPTVDAGTGGFSIPASTPFELTATGNDADGDLITYTWEQYDLGPSTGSSAAFFNPTGNQPIFRSWTGTVDPTRVFPRIQDLVNNTTAVGEILPTYSRGLTFRVTVRDNRAGGGGTNDDEISFNVDDAAGPFLVTAPNAGGSFPALAPTAISWDVAGTNNAPINCSNVDIYLSTDGGLTYPTLLLANAPNSGGATVTYPNITTSSARIKVKASNNVFFDISNQNFSITAPVGGVDYDVALVGVSGPSGDFCGDVVVPEFILANFGDITLTSATVNYDVDGSNAQSFNWTGTLTTGQQETITLSPITVVGNGAHVFNVAVSNPNGQADANASNNSGSSNFSTVTNATTINVNFLTDCWGEEVGWTLQDDQGNVLASLGTGSYEDQTTYNTEVCVSPGCFDLVITDTFGDGMAGTLYGSCGVDGNYTVTDQGGTVLVQMAAANYGAGITESFCVTPSGDVFGCTNPTACNFDPLATSDNGTCEFLSCAGCTDPTACNFDGSATIDDGSCDISCQGCTNLNACNYDASATLDDGSCEFLTCAGCTDNEACNFDPSATINDGSCDYACLGCTDPSACNFDNGATQDDGSCEFNSCAGCTDASACNYDASATIDDGSCESISCAGCTTESACNYDPSATIDNGTCVLATTFYADTDNDGFGDIDSPLDACSQPIGYVVNNQDCNDDNGSMYPGAPGTGEGVDNDCNGTITSDESDTCVGDLNFDGEINVQDLLMILAEMNCTEDCSSDLDGNGIVSTSDIIILINLFGSSCP